MQKNTAKMKCKEHRSSLYELSFFTKLNESAGVQTTPEDSSVPPQLSEHMCYLNFVFPSLTVVLAVFLYLGHYKKFYDDDDDDLLVNSFKQVFKEEAMKYLCQTSCMELSKIQMLVGCYKAVITLVT